MSIVLTVTDYSRPIQPLFEGPIQVGSVHSVFQRAMNITCGDTLLSVLSDELQRMPNSVRVPAGQIECLLARVRPEMAVFVGDSSLSIPACDLFVCLSAIAAWEPCPKLDAYQWNREVVARHAYMLAHYLAEVAHEEGLAALVCPLLLDRAIQLTAVMQKALPMVRLLMQAGRERNCGEVERAACGLLGLGPGLTPSGDDVLAGFAAVMVLLGKWLSVDGLSHEDIASCIAAAAPSRTTRLSAALLGYAARGEVAEQLGNVLVALASSIEMTEAVMLAGRDLLRFGATSGGDTLLGVLLGLRTLGW